jgi:hypothetical protein
MQNTRRRRYRNTLSSKKTRRRKNHRRHRHIGGTDDGGKCITRCVNEEEEPNKKVKPRNLRMYKMVREKNPDSNILQIKFVEYFPTKEELKKLKLATDDSKKNNLNTHINNTRVNSRLQYDDVDMFFKPFVKRQHVKPYVDIYAAADKWPNAADAEAEAEAAVAEERDALAYPKADAHIVSPYTYLMDMDDQKSTQYTK